MNKKIIFLLLGICIALFSCKDSESDDIQKETTVSDDKTAVSSAFDEMDLDIENMLNVDGMKTIQSLSSFLGKSDPITGDLKSSSGTDIISFFSSTSGLKASNGEINILDSLNGTYSWNNLAQDWDFSAIPGNKLVLKFPSDTLNPGTNDAVLTVDGIIMNTYLEDTMPTLIDLDLKDIDGNVYVDAYLTATYNSDAIPSTINASLTITPYTFTINFDNTSTSSAIANVSILESGSKMMGVGGTVNFYSSTKDSVISITNANVTYRTLMLLGGVNLAGIEEDSHNSQLVMENIIENNVMLTLNYSSDGSKIADLDFVCDNNEDTVKDVLLVYKDGTSESARDYIEPVITNIEEDMQNLDNFFNSSDSASMP